MNECSGATARASPVAKGFTASGESLLLSGQGLGHPSQLRLHKQPLGIPWLQIQQIRGGTGLESPGQGSRPHSALLTGE